MIWPAVGSIRLENGAARRGLAAAGLADHAERLALLDGEGDVVHGVQHAALRRVEILLEVIHLNQMLIGIHFIAHLPMAVPPSGLKSVRCTRKQAT
jgi:hypothetical protein